MTKSDLLGQFHQVRANYILGFAALSLLLDDKSLAILRETRMSIRDYEMPLEYISEGMKEMENKQFVFSEFAKMLLKVFVRESFELIKEYCMATGQNATLGNAHWYHFARLLRNAFSHDCRFRFRNHDKHILPITWRDKDITIQLEGTDIDIDFFSLRDGLELSAEMESFVKLKIA